MKVERAARLLGSALSLVIVASGCGDDGASEPVCVELPDTCSPGFTPNWDGVFSVIEQRCGGSAGTSCHGPQGRNGNLVLYEKAIAYDALLGMDGTHPRVEPTDAKCSVLMERLTTDDPDRRMPLRGSLTDSQICAIQQWIEQGANP